MFKSLSCKAENKNKQTAKEHREETAFRLVGGSLAGEVGGNPGGQDSWHVCEMVTVFPQHWCVSEALQDLNVVTNSQKPPRNQSQLTLD